MDLFKPYSFRRDLEGEIIPEDMLLVEQLARDCAKDKFRWHGYEKTVELADGLKPHVFGDKPVRIIDEARPNEPDDVKDYRLKVWRPETKGFFGRVMNVVSRIGAPTASTTIYRDEPSIIGDNSFREYTKKEYGDYDSIHGYTFEVLLEWMLGDANAVLLLMDIDGAYDENGVPKDGYFPNPQPYIYPAESVHWKVEREEYLILTEYKSKVTANQKQMQKGFVYLWIDTYGVYVVEQHGLQKDFNFRVIPLCRSHLQNGTTPAITTGGDLKTKGLKKWYESFIQPAVADWDKYIGSRSDLDAWKTRTMYPVPVIAATECKACRNKSTRSGWISDQKGNLEPCQSCNGTGRSVISFGPLSALHIDTDRNPNMKPQDAIYYPTIDTSLFEPAFKDLENFKRKGFEALNMEMLADSNQGDSGVKRNLDLKPFEDFLMRIAARIYFLYRWQFEVVAYMRYGGLESAQNIKFIDEMLPEITEPHNLSYVTLDMLYSELKQGKEGGAHSSLISNENVDIAVRKYGTDSEKTKRITAEIMLDPHNGQSSDDLLAGNAIGAVSTESLYIHWNIKTLVDIAIAENPEFLELPMNEQRAVIEGLAKGFLPEPTPNPQLEINPGEVE